MKAKVPMLIDGEKVAAARRASGMTIERAATICEISKPCYVMREKDPMMFRMHEIAHLYEALTDTAKPIFRDAVDSVFYLPEHPKEHSKTHA